MTRSRADRPLWTCPKCGLKFVTKNLWHSCGYATLESWLVVQPLRDLRSPFRLLSTWPAQPDSRR